MGGKRARSDGGGCVWGVSWCLASGVMVWVRVRVWSDFQVQGSGPGQARHHPSLRARTHLGVKVVAHNERGNGVQAEALADALLEQHAGHTHQVHRVLGMGVGEQT